LGFWCGQLFAVARRVYGLYRTILAMLTDNVGVTQNLVFFQVKMVGVWSYVAIKYLFIGG